MKIKKQECQIFYFFIILFIIYFYHFIYHLFLSYPFIIYFWYFFIITFYFPSKNSWNMFISWFLNVTVEENCLCYSFVISHPLDFILTRAARSFYLSFIFIISFYYLFLIFLYHYVLFPIEKFMKYVHILVSQRNCWRKLPLLFICDQSSFGFYFD